MKCFKAYDIRGRLPDELNPEIAWRIGRAFAETVGKGSVVVGYDVRLDSPALAEALSRGLTEGGCDVIDIGLCGTEEVYFQTAHRGVAGGIMVTASHNPIDYNGMKLVRDGARPVSGDSGLRDIERQVEANRFGAPAAPAGSVTHDHDKSAYVEHLLGYVDHAVLRPLRIVVNAGNGGAGLVIDQLAPHMPFEFIRIHHEPDGRFPHGIPNPLLPENRDAIHRFQYLPFGVGPRVCIGATFAMQEAIIALGVLMHRFRFDMTAETTAWPVQRLTTQPANGLMLKVTARPRASSIS